MKILHTNDMPWANALQRGAYWQRRKRLATEALSASLWELPPGKKSFPMHRHLLTDEAIFVISGHANVRSQDGTTPIGPGDFVPFVPGGDAHQLINDGTEPLIYLGVSAGKGNDVTEYPDSRKLHVVVAGKSLAFEEGDAVDYFTGEPDATRAE
jgi:uncharacterized cupin superfamily protein